MSAFPAASARFVDTPIAPPSPSEGREPRAARTAEGAPLPAPSASSSIAREVARICLEAAAAASFVGAVLFWSVVLSGG